MKKFLVVFILLVSVTNTVFAWNGYDYNSGSYIEIGDNNLVRSGRTINVYDYNKGEYIDYDVDNVSSNGNVEVTDPETGETRTFDMDNN